MGKSNNYKSNNLKLQVQIIEQDRQDNGSRPYSSMYFIGCFEPAYFGLTFSENPGSCSSNSSEGKPRKPTRSRVES